MGRLIQELATSEQLGFVTIADVKFVDDRDIGSLWQPDL
jgi:hypothetical protein